MVAILSGDIQSEVAAMTRHISRASLPHRGYGTGSTLPETLAGFDTDRS
jgi:hypothetical protein